MALRRQGHFFTNSMLSMLRPNKGPCDFAMMSVQSRRKGTLRGTYRPLVGMIIPYRGPVGVNAVLHCGGGSGVLRWVSRGDLALC